MAKIDALLSSPPDREKLVVELFHGDEGQWAEVNIETGKLMLELYPRQAGGPWALELDEVIKVLQLARERLHDRYGSDGHNVA